MTGPVTERVPIDRLGVTRLPITDVFTKAILVTSYTGTLRLAGKQPASIYQNVALNRPVAGKITFVGKQPTCAVTLHLRVAPSAGAIRIVPKTSDLSLAKNFPLAGVLRLSGQHSDILSQRG